MRRALIILAFACAVCGGARAQEARPLASASALAELLSREPEGGQVAPADGPEPASSILARTAPRPPGADVAEVLLGGIEQWHGQSERLASIAILGLPGAGERARARWSALNVLRLVAGAEDLALRVDRRAVVDGTIDPDFAGRLTHARGVILPLRAARALLVVGGASTEDSRRRLAQRALELVRSAEEVSVWSRVERALIEAEAHLLSGDRDASALALARIDAGDLDALPSFARERVIIERAMLDSLLRASPPDALPALEARRWDDPPLRLLVADVAMRVALARARGASSNIEASVRFAEGIRAYERVRIDTDGLPEGPQVRSLLYERLDSLPQQDMALDRLGLMAAAAFGSAGEIGAALDRAGSAPDPIRRDAEWFRADRRARAASGPDAWEGLVEFALAEPGDDRAPEALIRACARAERWLASRQGQGRGVERVDLDRALGAFRMAMRAPLVFEELWLIRLRGAELVAMQTRGAPEEVDRSLLRDGLALLGRCEDSGDSRRCREIEAELRRGLAEIGDDAARFVALMRSRMETGESSARLGSSPQDRRVEIGLLLAAASMERSAGDVERAIAALDVIVEGPETFEEAWKDRASALRRKFEILLEMEDISRASKVVELLGVDPRTRAGHLERCLALSNSAWTRLDADACVFLDSALPDEMLRAADRIEQCASLAGDRLDGELLQRLAWARLVQGDPQGAAHAFGRLSAPDRRGLGEALLRDGDDAGAFEAFRELAERSAPASREYFHAWIRMLEILERRPDSQARTARIRRELGRLRSAPELEQFGPCAERIDALERRLGAARK